MRRGEGGVMKWGEFGGSKRGGAGRGRGRGWVIWGRKGGGRDMVRRLSYEGRGGGSEEEMGGVGV